MEIVMKYEDARRLRGVESAWLRLKFWWQSSHMAHRLPKGDLNDLPDYLRRDIGLAEPVRYMDWRALQDVSRS
jgi:hypothetical protein